MEHDMVLRIATSHNHNLPSYNMQFVSAIVLHVQLFCRRNLDCIVRVLARTHAQPAFALHYMLLMLIPDRWSLSAYTEVQH